MNKYDYITATTLEEKVRLEKLIKYMEDNNIEDNLLEYKERYNNICKYLVAKDKYLNIEKDIDDIKIKAVLEKNLDKYDLGEEVGYLEIITPSNKIFKYKIYASNEVKGINFFMYLINIFKRLFA